MSDPLRLSFIVVLLVEFILGISLNGFIVSTLSREWWKCKRLESRDIIVVSLCLSRIFLQLVITLHNFLRTFLPEIYITSYVIEVFLVMGIFLSFTSLWIAALLSIFYCVKITNYNLGLFVFLKKRISQLVPWLVFLSLLVSLASSLPLSWYVFTLLYRKSTVGNFTQTIIVVSQDFVNQSLIHSVCSSVPFTIFSVAVILLIHSLWRHSRQMKKSGNSFRTPNLDSHVSVVRNLVIFFFLYLVYFISMNLTLSGLPPVGSPWMVLASIIVSAYPFLHSAVIIFTNRQLKETFISLLSHMAPKELSRTSR